MADTYRVLLYSHDSLGLGHVRRNLTIAHHLVRHLPEATGAQVAGLLVSGLADASGFPLPEGFDWLTIPGVTGTIHGYRPRRLPGATGELIKLRSQLLEGALLGFNPDLVIIDRHIYGVMKELQEPLLKLRILNPSVKVVLGLREVLDDPQMAAVGWERLGPPEQLRDVLDEIWAYGDPDVYDPTTTGEIPSALTDCIRFTGYLAHDRHIGEDSEPLAPRPFVLTTAGGGSDGHELLRAAVAMRPPAGHENIIVTGPQLDDADYEAIAAQAGPGTQVHRSWPGLGSQIDQAAAVIAMGGYNTACEILATTTGEIPSALTDCIRFTGYLAHDRHIGEDSEPLAPRPFVLTTAGGGSDGHELLRAAVAMRPPAGHENIIVTGPQLDDADYEAIAAQAGPGTQVHRSWPGLGSQIDQAAAVIAMGGYNTACEILATDTPALVVPRETPTPEQLIRARALRDAGAIDVLRAPSVTADALSAWVAGAVTRRVGRSHIERDGLAATAGFAADLLLDDEGSKREVVA